MLTKVVFIFSGAILSLGLLLLLAAFVAADAGYGGAGGVLLTVAIWIIPVSWIIFIFTGSKVGWLRKGKTA